MLQTLASSATGRTTRPHRNPEICQNRLEVLSQTLLDQTLPGDRVLVNSVRKPDTSNGSFLPFSEIRIVSFRRASA